MGGRKRQSSPNANAEKSSVLSDALENQLSHVVEQDGATIATPRGVRKRKATSSSRLFKKPAPTMEETVTDEVQDLDRSALTKLVKAKGGSHSAKITIKKGAHQRSPYVVSLRNVPLSPVGPASGDRPDLKANYAPGEGLKASASPVNAYASVSADLTTEHDPWTTRDQFTSASFDEAYTRVYGRFDRVRSVFGDAANSVRRLFIRVETAERKAVDDVEELVEESERAPTFSFARALVGFLALALLVTVPAGAVAIYRSVSAQKAVAAGDGEAAINELLAAANADSVASSADDLKQASSQFRSADAELTQSNALAIAVASVLPKTYHSANALLEAGDKASEAGRLLALGFNKVFDDPGRRLDERLDVLSDYSKSALQLLSDASKDASSIDPSTIPAAQRDNATALFSTLNQSTQAVQEFATLSDALSGMVGRDSLRKYLVIFQNQTELRPTGGFMGSLAEVTMDQGAITDVHVPTGGTYDLQGQLLARVIPPQPLQLVNALWQFQDANWSPDFPTSAAKIRWFWDTSRQSSVDGVIAINATYVEKLLDITGPIDMPDYGKTINSSNFLAETQVAVEVDYDKKANTPKKFVGDLMNKIMDRTKTFTKDDWLKVLALTSDSLQTKDIQVAFTNPDEEALAEKYGWNGRMKETSGDALALIEANIGGQKTDGSIAEQVTHNATIADDGSIEDTVTLTRTHNGIKGQQFSGVRNVSYLRTYVPQGSTLLSATGFNTPAQSFFQKVDTTTETQDPDVAAVEATDVDFGGGVTVSQEGSRTVFGGWMQLDPGQTQTITLTYRLPMTTSDMLAKLEAAPGEPSSDMSHGAYSLLLTSQSGKDDRTYQTSINYPASWAVSWSQAASSTPGVLTDAGTWDRDQVVAALFATSNGQIGTQNASGN
ncbi:MAG: DUF4012 domain-containing protein [Patescibacteria group bacterium]